MAEKSVQDEIQDVLNKMARAHARGNGCRLTAREMDVLYITQVGAWWGQPDEREPAAATQQEKSNAD